MNFISVDPGEHTGIVAFHGGLPVLTFQLRISSTKGAKLLEEIMQEIIEQHESAVLVIENQYAQKGRSFSSPIGTASYRGAVEHIARRNGLKIHKVKPNEWMYPVLAANDCKWRAPKKRKDDVIRKVASRLLGLTRILDPVEQHKADATAMGHHWYCPGFYL